MTSRTRLLATTVLAAGALTVLSGCGGVVDSVIDGAASAAGGASTAAGDGSTAAAGPGDDTSVFELAVGQCLNSETAEGEVQSVPIVDCGQPHQGEIFSLPQLPDGDFPGADTISQTAQEECTGPAYTDYVGVPYPDSEFDVTFLLPTAETWGTGDREIACIVAATEPGSVRGSGR